MLKLPKITSKDLSFRLSLMAVSQIALLLLVALAVMFFFSRNALKEESMRDAEQTLEGTVQQIDNILLSVEQTTGIFYGDIQADLNHPDKMEAYCTKIVESNPYIVGCAIAFKPDFYPDRDSFMIYVHRKGYEIEIDGGAELVSQDYFTRRPYTEQPWVTEPLASGRARWIDPLKDDFCEGEPLVSFCLPLFDKDNNCIGVVASDLPLRLLTQIVLGTKTSPNGYSTLLARNGSYIVHPDPVKLSHQTVFLQMEYGADYSVMEAAESMLAGETGHKFFRMDKRNWYVFYKPFERAQIPGRTMEQLGWSVGVVYPEDDIYGGHNLLLFYLLAIAIIVLVVLFVLCRWVNHRQLLPLIMLTRSSKRIAKGNYDEIIPDTDREDEIGVLQKNFQKMQKSLAEHVGEQEKLSATLKERSGVLKKAYKRSQEADKMKSSFLHFVTNQMTGPSEAIDRSVTTLCNNYHDISLEEVDREINIIKTQSDTIIDLLNHMLQTAESETGKEDAHE